MLKLQNTKLQTTFFCSKSTFVCIDRSNLSNSRVLKKKVLRCQNSNKYFFVFFFFKRRKKVFYRRKNTIVNRKKGSQFLQFSLFFSCLSVTDTFVGSRIIIPRTISSIVQVWNNTVVFPESVPTVPVSTLVQFWPEPFVHDTDLSGNKHRD